jgi:hypothetical protein
MYAAKAEVKSDKAASYLVQLCKHFAHKVPTEYDETRGRVDFQLGNCEMRSSGDLLILECRAESEPGLERLMQVVADHLVRFAWKENLVISWTKAAETLSDC